MTFRKMELHEYQKHLALIAHLIRQYSNQGDTVLDNCMGSATTAVALKTFVDLFSESMGVVEAHKRKAEIEAAVLKVYGARYSTTNYWLLSELQKVAQAMKDEINKPAATDACAQDTSEKADLETDDLPF